LGIGSLLGKNKDILFKCLWRLRSISKGKWQEVVCKKYRPVFKNGLPISSKWLSSIRQHTVLSFSKVQLLLKLYVVVLVMWWVMGCYLCFQDYIRFQVHQQQQFQKWDHGWMITGCGMSTGGELQEYLKLSRKCLYIGFFNRYSFITLNRIWRYGIYAQMGNLQCNLVLSCYFWIWYFFSL
jgi:hypothetical protein